MSPFEQTAENCADAIRAREVAKLIESASILIARACERANATERFLITATTETYGVTQKCADKLAQIAADIMHKERSNA